MSALLIWMNTHEAKLFHVGPNSINMEKVEFHGPEHHAESLGRNHTKDQGDEQKFFRQLTEKLKSVDSGKWLLMGPGLGPVHFKGFLESHHKNLDQKIIGVEKVDKMPDSEILSVGRKYLQRYYLFHSA